VHNIFLGLNTSSVTLIQTYSFLLHCFFANVFTLFSSFCLLSRLLRELNLQENDVEDRGSRWLSCFPDSCTSLVSLNFACIKGEVDSASLERLVAKSPNLRSLRLNRAVSADTLSKILMRTPNLEDLGTGNLPEEFQTESYIRLANALANCKMLKSLSGFWDASPVCVPYIYPLCHQLTGLNLSYIPTLDYSDLTNMISRCVKLQRLWVSLSLSPNFCTLFKKASKIFFAAAGTGLHL
jgi:hypothetical protein